MVPRKRVLDDILRALGRSRIVALLGPRQCGKTTLARQIVAPDSLNYFDLEDPISLARLSEPMTALTPLKGTIVIDEIQRDAKLFPILRVLSDRDPLSARFLILGSASPGLVRESSETLAGRVETIALGGLSLDEVGTEAMQQHWLRGGFPPSYLAESVEDSAAWRRNFIQTFVERDVPQLSPSVPSVAILRFWTMAAHYHGGIWNGSEFARSLGVNEPSVRRHLDTLSGLFMVRQLLPWHENLKKRQVKSPKVYVRDSGLLHYLVGIRSELELLSHPKLGVSWEGYAIEETMKAVRPDEAYFWATHQGAELDLLLFKDGRRFGMEIKRQDAPQLTRSILTALEDLRLEHLTVLYPGDRTYLLNDKVTVMPLSILAQAGVDWLSGGPGPSL